MKKTITRIALIAGIASATAFGSHFAQADEGGKFCHEYAKHHHEGHNFMHHRFEKMAAKLRLPSSKR